MPAEGAVAIGEIHGACLGDESHHAGGDREEDAMDGRLHDWPARRNVVDRPVDRVDHIGTDKVHSGARSGQRGDVQDGSRATGEGHLVDRGVTLPVEKGSVRGEVPAPGDDVDVSDGGPDHLSDLTGLRCQRDSSDGGDPTGEGEEVSIEHAPTLANTMSPNRHPGSWHSCTSWPGVAACAVRKTLAPALSCAVK